MSKKSPTKTKTKRKPSGTKSNGASSERTHIHMVLDRSGSMSVCRDETIAAVNVYLSDSRKDKKLREAHFTLTIFDNNSIDDIRSGTLSEVADLGPDDFVPRGLTPLYDAIGRGVSALDANLAKSGAKRAALVIVTDGAENASQEYTHSRILSLIKARQDAGWQVLFLGAGIAAASQGVALGVRAGTIASIGTSAAQLAAVGQSMSAMNSCYAQSVDYAAAATQCFGEGQRLSMGDASAGNWLNNGGQPKTTTDGTVRKPKPRKLTASGSLTPADKT